LRAIFWQLVFVAGGWSHGLLDEQIEAVSRELAQAPRDEELLLKRAELHRAHGDYPKAKADLERVIGGGNDYAEAWFSLARLEREAGHLPASKVAILRFLELGESEPRGQREAAIIFEGLEDWKTSAKYWRDVFGNSKFLTRTAPDFEASVRVQIAAKEWAAAGVLLGEGVRKFPNAIPLIQLQGELSMTHGRWDEAHEILQRLRGRYPTLAPRLCLQEGKMWAAYRQRGRAREVWQIGLRALNQLPALRRDQPGMVALATELHHLLKK